MRLEGAAVRTGALIEDRYRLVRCIGSGGMGEVWEALHEAIGRRVALKILLPQYAKDREVVARFHREARATSKIGDPRIVDVLDMGLLSDGAPYLVMELLVGETLGQLLGRQGQLSIRSATRIASEIASALGAAHEADVIHRDLKPENVFLLGSSDTPEYERPLKVLDFGVAKVRSAEDEVSLTQTGAAVGTPTYMSPEQASGLANVDARSDVWSLGVLLYRMLAGQTPFVGDSYALLLVAILAQPPTSILKFRGDLPPALERLLMQLLAKDRSERPGSMAEVVKRLEPFAGWTLMSGTRAVRPEPRRAPLDDDPTIYTPSSAPPPHRAPSTPMVREPAPRPFASTLPAARPGSTMLTAEELARAAEQTRADQSGRLDLGRSRPAGSISRRTEPSAPARRPPGAEPTGSQPARAIAALPRNRTPPVHFAMSGEQRIAEPGDEVTISLEELLRGVPPGASIKAMFLTEVLARHADRAELLEAAGVSVGRWVAFSDAGFSEWVRLVDASARLRFGRAGRAGSLRAVAQTAYEAFAASLAGKVIFGSLGQDADRILEALPRFEVNVVPLKIEGTRIEPNHHRLVMSGFGPKVVEGLLLGIVQGALARCPGPVTYRLEVENPTRTVIDVRVG